MNIVTFFVPGKPGTAGSKRAFIVKRKRDGKPVAVVTDASKSSKDWKGDVKRFASEEYTGALLEGPIALTLTFYLARPQAHFGKLGKAKLAAPSFPQTRPDLLKYARAVEDALTGVIWLDDSQIVTELLKKRFVVGPVQQPGVLIELRHEMNP